MRVTIVKGRLVSDEVFEGVKKFLLGTIETKSKRIKPVLTFNFINNQEDQGEENDVQLIDEEIRKIRLEEKVDKSNTGKDFDYFFNRGQDIRQTLSIPNDELIVLLTGERNNRNFLGYIDDSMLNAFVYTNGWNRIYSNIVDTIFPIIYEIYCWILRANMFDNSTELYQSVHKDNKGCAMDFCENLRDHSYKSRTNDICETCNDFLIQKLFREDIKQYIYKSLEKVRLSILRRNNGRTDVTNVELKDVDGTRQFIVPGYNDQIIKLEPLWKSIYYFFLLHSEGIASKDVINYRNELYKMYKYFSKRESGGKNNKDNYMAIQNESINRLIGYNQGEVYTGKKNLSIAITSVNSVLKTIFNENIIDEYLIKNRKGKYTILLDRDHFIDNSGIIL
jgi:hypothetical protein